MRQLLTGAFERCRGFLPDRDVLIRGSLPHAGEATDCRVRLTESLVGAPAVRSLQAWRREFYCCVRARKGGVWIKFWQFLLYVPNYCTCTRGAWTWWSLPVVLPPFAPYVIVGQVQLWFGKVVHFPAAGALLRALSPGEPIHVSSGGYLEVTIS